MVGARVIELINYPRLSDEELVRRAQSGDRRAQDEIFTRYADMVRIKAGSYYLIGADQEDLVQEGLIGLYKAIRDYRKDREASFKAFAELCITRQLITAVKTATRQKHMPLNCYVSLTSPLGDFEEEDRVLMDLITSNETVDPIEVVIGDEEAESLQRDFIKMLSRLETEVLRLYMEGLSYKEIARDLDRQVKSIDNALQRIKRKVEQHLRFREMLSEGSCLRQVSSVAG